MAKRKNVLIADDDELLIDGMRALLTSDEWKITACASGELAKNLISNSPFDLIIADLQLPEVDGLQLLAHAKEKSPAKFLLISDFTEIFKQQHALQLGADEFLMKPFSKAEFNKAIHVALGGERTAAVTTTGTTTGEDPTDPNQPDFIQVPLSEFISGSTLLVDIYVRLNDRKYLKIGHKGQTMAASRMNTYVAKGLTWLYMQKTDFAFYVQFNLRLAQLVHTEKKIESIRKIRLTQHVTDTLIAQICEAGVDKSHLENASNVIMNAIDLISDNADMLKLLENMEVAGTLPAHSIAVSLWSCLLAKELGWTGQQTFFKVALSGLFHDVGEREIPEHLFNKERFELSRHELQLVQSHTTRGRDILQSIRCMPEDVPVVAMQHHELMHGGGYPFGLRMEQIHPLARLVTLADHFCEAIRRGSNEQALDLKSAFEKIVANKRDFDPMYVAALENLLSPVIDRMPGANAAS